MRKGKKINTLWLLLLLAIIVFFFALYNGASTVKGNEVWQALFQFDPTDQAQQIIRNIRLPRVIGAFIVGSCFALSGALMQGVTRNNLADSGLLGINAGASLAMAFSFAFLPKASPFSIFLLSLLGSLIVTMTVLGFFSFSKIGLSTMQMILAGVAISSFFTAISQALTQLFNLQQDLTFWFVGGAANITWQQLLVLSPIYLVAVIGSFLLGKSISLIHLSESHAIALGGHPQRTRVLVFIFVSILAALAVSLVGPVSFIGLMVPPVVRGFVGTDYRYVLPASFIAGGILVMLADFVARMINPPFETPFGLVISLIGVPFLLVQVRRERV
ncbi:FecCD family ABC transporter permease [Enterococcus mundtii]|uniref:Ferrichrome ABC transporter permease n=1 Tax=Enterococcus mundtii TaxID=53346 RepID=A0ABQ0VGL9_ENTMU|nr:iron ABC transporter permease [Enterococcus mundtii]GEN20810.1 ferrichrome ABC transporter permease [Ligilactobacillus acidipiscis]AUB52965.1 ferrichrome ABC transporter permease [Enterococcus mundtii]MZZ58397.1 iron chelate uptake ABC transporter family permease subunit [Enterococcus mundtii]MZZ61373.1 iron chelate uptake ABC transporter family permease subunit [Enterococcus mundtii]MZZ68357.1 iron chelate uptake ABC transporter family permease subunit [Enterococcus mundtii]